MSAPSLIQKVTNIKHMPVLLAATVATKESTDGYLIKDIVKMSFESQQTRIFLQQYLTNLLITTNNVYTKMKVMRLFIILFEEGHIEFKQNLRKTPEPFNEASKLRPHHPKDKSLISECGRIRDMANKALDLLYMDVPELRKTSFPVDSSYLEEKDSSSHTRITGLGNTAPPKSFTTDKLKLLFGTSGGKTNTKMYDPSYATMDPVPHNVSSNQSPFIVHVPHSSGQMSGAAPVGASHEQGQAGGGWASSSVNQNQTSHHNSTSNQWSSSNHQKNQERREVSSEQSRIEQEQRLVDEITASGGVRVAPPRDSLTTFIKRCKVLDSLSVVECLRFKLASEDSQVVLRVLFVMEALLRSDVPDIQSQFDLVLQDLTDITSSPNSSIKAKANKILVQLTSANAQRMASSRTTAGQQLTSSGDDDQREEEEEDEVELEVESEETQGVASIFSGLSVSGEKAQGLPKQQPRKKMSKKTTPTTTKLSSKATLPSAPRPSKVQQEKNAFEDILGLGDFSSDPTEIQASSSSLQGPPLPPALMHGRDEELQDGGEVEDDSLLMFEEDIEFDPLKRSDSEHRSNSLGLKTAPPLSSSDLPSQPVLLESHAQTPPTVTLTTKTKDSSSLLNPMTPSCVGGGGNLAGVGPVKPTTQLDSIAGHTPLKQQDSLSEMFSALQMASSSVPPHAMMSSSMSMATSYPPSVLPMVSGPSATLGGFGQVPLGQKGCVVYGPGQLPVSYLPQAQAPQTLLYMNQFGGVSRPVQMAAAKEQVPLEGNTGFSFISKSNKSNAFDFVQDEMKASSSMKHN